MAVGRRVRGGGEIVREVGRLRIGGLEETGSHTAAAFDKCRARQRRRPEPVV